MKKKTPGSRRRRIPLLCKWWWRGMAKTNYRKHGKKNKFKVDINDDN